MDEPEIPLAGGSHSGVVRVGQTVRRMSRPCSAAIHDLFRHFEHAGFAGAPRALGFDDQGREVLTYIEGDVPQRGDYPRRGERFDRGLPDFVWPDDVLVQIGELIRASHDAAATYAWSDREWPFAPRPPVETMCHNEPFPLNTVFRDGVPVAFIDWDTAAPAPRAWDLGCAAWRWVPLWRDEKCQAHGLPTGIDDKARRLRLLVNAYGLEPDLGIVRAAIARMREFLAYQHQLVAEGSDWEVQADRRGELDEQALEIAWVEEHAVALVES